MNHLTNEELKRFNGKWVQSGECRLWQGPLDKDGYGTFYFRKKSRRAHRVAVFNQQGPIPEELVVDHLCKMRNCVAAEHLRIVTRSQNSLENTNSIAAMNRLKTTCIRGHEFDRVYSGIRYCSICMHAKKARLRKKWKEEADQTKC